MYLSVHWVLLIQWRPFSLSEVSLQREDEPESRRNPGGARQDRQGAIQPKVAVVPLQRKNQLWIPTPISISPGNRPP